MVDKSRGFILIGLAMLLVASLLGGPLGPQPAWGSETGTLKLMVTDCISGGRLDNAQVDVVIWRKGTGQIDSDSDYTDDGYVEFEFNGLEQDDQAHVTVTPYGEGDPDDGHSYIWEASTPRNPGVWDLGVHLDGPCDDGWWDESENIIECVYSDPSK